MNYVIKDNAKLDEIKAYFVLKDVLFKDKLTLIGDDWRKMVPDIYTKDLSIGVEVVSCEHISSYLHETLILSNPKKVNRVSLEFCNNLINEYENLSLKDKQLLFNAEFEKQVSKKLRKIENYSGVEDLNLFVMSDNENKNFIRREILLDLYKNACKGRKKVFHKLYFYYNNKLFVSTNGENFKKISVKSDILTR